MAYTYGQQIWNALMLDIGNEYGVAGLMGNLEAESALNPMNLENGYEETSGFTDETYTQAVDSGTYTENQFVNDWYGYGLAQWTFPSRKQGLYDMKKTMGVSIGDVNLACAYLLHELKTTYREVYDVLKTATDIRTASDKVLHDFENPLVQDTAVEIYRAGLGTALYVIYTGSIPTPPPTSRKRKKYNFILFKKRRYIV
jgi:hypothetical protein